MAHTGRGSQEPFDSSLARQLNLPQNPQAGAFHQPMSSDPFSTGNFQRFPTTSQLGPQELAWRQRNEKVDYRKEIGQPRAANFMMRRIKDNYYTIDTNGCWLPRVALSSSGYPQTRFWSNSQVREARARGVHINAIGQVQKNFAMHRISHLAYYGSDTEEGHTASHLCDVPQCVNPEHIQSESLSDNVSRRSCRRITCLRHNNVIMDNCGHNPKCVMKHFDTLQCCPGAHNSSGPSLVRNFSGQNHTQPSMSSTNSMNRFSSSGNYENDEDVQNAARVGANVDSGDTHGPQIDETAIAALVSSRPGSSSSGYSVNPFPTSPPGAVRDVGVFIPPAPGSSWLNPPPARGAPSARGRGGGRGQLSFSSSPPQLPPRSGQGSPPQR